MLERGIGAGFLSGAAETRLATPQAAVPVAMPDLDDHAAVAAWRQEINDGWGEDDDEQYPHRAVEYGGVPCLDAGSADAPVVVYAHGGGYVLGSAATAIPITARLAPRLRVISVDYRMAPEHPAPAAVDDVVAVCRALGADGTPFAVAGDSAGGGLVLAAAVALRDAGVPGPSSMALFSPHLDHALSRRPGPEITELAALSIAYVGSFDPADPIVSPLRADLSDLCPVLVQASDDEALAPQSVILSRRLRAQGARCELDLYRGLWHAFHYHRDVPEADVALSEAVEFILSAAKPR